ncbi:MAG: hypothetical protein L3K52_01060 [Candidatus Thiothrix sulfatifontis]|nr:MAG: hypothetical protein L3K52_01060 [Candidatus Thiothrix sulfatifontis]
MKAKAVMVLAAIASAGLAACSPSSQAVRSADAGVMPPTMNNPAAQSASHYSSQNISRQAPVARNGMPELSPVELQVIGDQIFKNEGGGNVSNLVHWNEGENFASMGIGHFTWYPAGRQARFGSTFPELLSYMQARGVQVPAWLPREGAPWGSKAELMQAKQTPQVQELQNFLYQTRLLQVQFIVDRTRRAMPKLVTNTPNQLRPHVVSNLNAVANTPGGWYALIDYTNFKGEGLSRSGGYNGQNWGLLQVLEEMRPARPGEQALHEFADAAMRVLERRVRNSPPANNERRWLAGWSSRVNTYRRLLA